MANKSRFVIAEGKIKSFFKDGPKVYSRIQLAKILEEYRAIWNLPLLMYTDKFIDRLISSGILTSKEILLMNKKERFITADASVFDIAISLVSKSYLSHSTAVFLNGLTNQVSKTVYISFEQSKKTNSNRKLTQEAIDSAFMKPQRRSTNGAIYEDYNFLLLNSMYSNRSGVYNIGDCPVTNIERTLIDISVRPSYAGGVDSVLEAYKRALDKISINKFIAILDRLNFIYPYYQAIGFYLERAGLDNKRLDVFRKMEKSFDFYLTYEILEKEYDPNWRLYYPKGM